MAAKGESDKGAHQNVARVSMVLGALAESARTGLRLTDLVKATGLSKTVAHRFLTGMMQHGLVEQDELSGRYFLGLNMVVWSAAAGNRYGLKRLAEPALLRLAEATEDTVYLMLRSGEECICIDRKEGAFPIRTLTLDVGDRRPLGAGAGPLAILSYLPDEEIDDVLLSARSQLARFKFEPGELRRLVQQTRENGFATIDNRIVPGLSGVAVPLRRRDGVAFAAINVVAISQRMADSRRREIATRIQSEADKLGEDLAAVLSVDGVEQITRSTLPA